MTRDLPADARPPILPIPFSLDKLRKVEAVLGIVERLAAGDATDDPNRPDAGSNAHERVERIRRENSEAGELAELLLFADDAGRQSRQDDEDAGAAAAQPDPEPARRRLPVMEQNEAAVLDELQRLGINPLEIPRPPNGRTCPEKQMVLNYLMTYDTDSRFERYVFTPPVSTGR